MKTQGAFGFRAVAVHLEQRRQRRADSAVGRLKLIGDLARKIGDEAVAVGSPEPAGALFLELADQQLRLLTLC